MVIKDRQRTHPLVIDPSQMEDEVPCAGAASTLQTVHDSWPLIRRLPAVVHVTRGPFYTQCPHSSAPGRYRPSRMVLGMYTRRHQSRMRLRHT